MFIYTLPSPYYDKVVGNIASNFANLVVVGERIELGIRRRKFSQESNNSGFAMNPASEKKKGEANVALVELGKANAPSNLSQIHVGSRSAATYTNPPPSPYVPPYQPRADTRAATNSRPAQQGTRRPPRTLAPIPMPYKQVEIIHLKPLEPPYPRSDNPNARCDYHGGAIGHATKMYWSLKHKVQDLLDGGLLGFQDQEPNVQNNPLPTHKGMVVNTISHENKDEAEGGNKTEREEGAARCTTNSTNWWRKEPIRAS
ncbi:hypothetical protein CR513_17153, partial [Mucuna pruriens]